MFPNLGFVFSKWRVKRAIPFSVGYWTRDVCQAGILDNPRFGSVRSDYIRLHHWFLNDQVFAYLADRLETADMTVALGEVRLLGDESP